MLFTVSNNESELRKKLLEVHENTDVTFDYNSVLVLIEGISNLVKSGIDTQNVSLVSNLFIFLILIFGEACNLNLTTSSLSRDPRTISWQVLDPIIGSRLHCALCCTRFLVWYDESLAFYIYDIWYMIYCVFTFSCLYDMIISWIASAGVEICMHQRWRLWNSCRCTVGRRNLR